MKKMEKSKEIKELANELFDINVNTRYDTKIDVKAANFMPWTNQAKFVLHREQIKVLEGKIEVLKEYQTIPDTVYCVNSIEKLISMSITELQKKIKELKDGKLS